MKNNYIITPASANDNDMILDALIEFDLECMPHLPRIDIQKCDFVLRSPEGIFMGGINAEHFWGILAIKFLCVDKPFRGQRLGTILMNHVEQQAKDQGCYMVHLVRLSKQRFLYQTWL
jgi:GNAT superfamily N-acetyltransferase